jgi:hypothetical protein
MKINDVSSSQSSYSVNNIKDDNEVESINQRDMMNSRSNFEMGARNSMSNFENEYMVNDSS